MGHVLCAWTELEDGKNLRERIDGQPQPQHLGGAAQPGSNFVQLEVWDLEGAEAALMEGLSMLAGASEPDGNGRLSVPKDPFGGRSIQPFSKGREHYGDLVGRGFQAVQWGVAPSGEGGVTGLTAKRLDSFGTSILAVSHQSMDGVVCDPVIRALSVGTGVALGVHA